MKQTQAELEQQESWFGKHLTRSNLMKAAGGALALGAVALAAPHVRQSMRDYADRQILEQATRLPPTRRDMWYDSWAREAARQRNT